MKNKKRLQKIWNQVPPNYYEVGITKNILQRYWHNEKLSTFKRLIRNKKVRTILDVGCASGRMANEISKILPNSKIVGVDVYKKAVDFGKKQYPHLKLIVADSHKLPFKNKSFDLVICYETIEHVKEPRQVLEEIRRVVKKKGYALVVMDSGNTLFRIVWWIWEKTKGKVWKDAHLHPFHHTELKKLIMDVGFKIVKVNFSHFGMEVSFLLKCK